MDQILEQWREYLLNSRNASPHTVRNYLSDAKQFCQCAVEKGFDPLKLDRITARVYLGFLAGKYASRASIMRKRDSIKQLYRFLVLEGLVPLNPFLLLDRMKVERDLPKFLSQDEAVKLIASIDVNPELMKKKFGIFSRHKEAAFLVLRDTALIETIYSTGTRAQETANLNWEDIDFRTGFLRVNQGKGRKDRIIPVGESAMAALWEWGKAYREHFDIEPRGKSPVFLSRRKMRISTRNIQKAINLRLQLAGINTKISTHGLRHSFATHLMQNGCDIVTIAECLGHASLSATQKYTHVTLTEMINHYDRAHPRA